MVLGTLRTPITQLDHQKKNRVPPNGRFSRRSPRPHLLFRAFVILVATTTFAEKGGCQIFEEWPSEKHKSKKEKETAATSLRSWRSASAPAARGAARLLRRAMLQSMGRRAELQQQLGAVAEECQVRSVCFSSSLWLVR